MTKIFLEDVKIYAYHGVLPEEQKIGTYYLVNAEFHTDFSSAMETDNLQDTISYADLNDMIHAEMKTPSQLMEHILGRILKRIENDFPTITYTKLKITKIAPPMQGEMKGASVEVARYF
ncbi:MAG: dihydroneopterin aldolase [Bergeyella zoohelcum]|nr:dihydroneopterin aldolase [Bergeyella zoohelcum]